MTFVSVKTVTPSSAKRFVTGATMCEGSCGNIRDAASTIVTFEPTFARAVPNSKPMYPPPTMTVAAGTVAKFNTSVESRMRIPSRGRAATVAGRDPVATTHEENFKCIGGCSSPNSTAP
ncbi:unannotated protein [freshwater metagenome]|uniref:Unannotated protein n=1 Tax=freshwater metagenome TaxID=449393 RepID=A0A6J5YZF1_9ZZZZ